MSDQGTPNYNELMDQAVGEHIDRNLAAALRHRHAAYEYAEPGSLDQGRAARDIGATYLQLGWLNVAIDWAEEAYRVHSGHAEREPESWTALRERAASGMYLGAIALRAELTGNPAVAQRADPLAILRQAWEDIHDAETRSGHPLELDQYEINIGRRIAVAEALHGDRRQAVALGWQAVRLAFSSESPRLATANHHLTPYQQLRAKARALTGGLAALGAGIVVRATNNPQSAVARWLALGAL